MSTVKNKNYSLKGQSATTSSAAGKSIVEKVTDQNLKGQSVITGLTAGKGIVEKITDQKLKGQFVTTGLTAGSSIVAKTILQKLKGQEATSGLTAGKGIVEKIIDQKLKGQSVDTDIAAGNSIVEKIKNKNLKGHKVKAKVSKVRLVQPVIKSVSVKISSSPDTGHSSGILINDGIAIHTDFATSHVANFTTDHSADLETVVVSYAALLTPKDSLPPPNNSATSQAALFISDNNTTLKTVDAVCQIAHLGITDKKPISLNPITRVFGPMVVSGAMCSPGHFKPSSAVTLPHGVHVTSSCKIRPYIWNTFLNLSIRGRR